MLTDAAYFIHNGGQRGQQTTVLKPGAYRMNLFLWKYKLASATDIPQGFVGVVNPTCTRRFGLQAPIFLMARDRKTAHR